MLELTGEFQEIDLIMSLRKKMVEYSKGARKGE